jgi:folate-binding protein YgfZ
LQTSEKTTRKRHMRNVAKVIALEDLGVLRARGADAVKFLQGQLSNDVARLSAQQSLLAGYHNPQGRAIALLRLVQWEPDDILAVVPRELAAVVAARLAKFVLRAKAKITDESTAWLVSGLVAATDARGAGAEGVSQHDARGIRDAGVLQDATGHRPGVDDGSQRSLALRDLPSSVGAQARGDGAVFVCVDNQPARWLVVSPADQPSPVSDHSPADRQVWQQLDVAAGLPQIFTATSEEFVAQMLNLDALNAIAFDKGCYTGQEVIARAHYRGRVKRRMQRFVSREACQLTAGESAQLADGRALKVVLAAQLPDGRCDFLAVAPLVTSPAEPSTTDPAAAIAAGPANASPSGATAAATASPSSATTPAAASPSGATIPATASPSGATTPATASPSGATTVGAVTTASNSTAAPAVTSSPDISPAAAILLADQAELPYPLPN